MYVSNQYEMAWINWLQLMEFFRKHWQNMNWTIHFMHMFIFLFVKYGHFFFFFSVFHFPNPTKMLYSLVVNVLSLLRGWERCKLKYWILSFNYLPMFDCCWTESKCWLTILCSFKSLLLLLFCFSVMCIYRVIYATVMNV